MEVSRPEFSEVTWKVKALALGEGKPPFFVAMVCVLQNLALHFPRGRCE